MQYKFAPDSDSLLVLNDEGEQVGSIPADPRNADYLDVLEDPVVALLPSDPVKEDPRPEIEGLPDDVRKRIEGFRAMTPMQLVDYVNAKAVDFDSLKAIAVDLALALSLVAGRVHLRQPQ